MLTDLQEKDIHTVEAINTGLGGNKEVLKKKYYHLIILVQNQVGLKNLYRICLLYTSIAIHEVFSAMGFGKKQWYLYAAAVPLTLLVMLSTCLLYTSPGSAHRQPLQQSQLRLRRLLPAQGHQAAVGALRRCAGKPD